MNLIFFCVLTYAIIYVLIHQIIFRFYLLKYSLPFSSTLVLTSSIDVVFILSILWVWFYAFTDIDEIKIIVNCKFYQFINSQLFVCCILTVFTVSENKFSSLKTIERTLVTCRYASNTRVIGRLFQNHLKNTYGTYNTYEHILKFCVLKYVRMHNNFA